MKKPTTLYLSLALLALCTTLHGQSPAHIWADSLYATLSEQERLGQLFMIRAHSDKGPAHVADVKAQIEKYKVGGLCFFQGTPKAQVQLINEYQAMASPVPLMMAIDGEWGLGMRMKATTMSFPKQLTLGAIQDNRLIYDMGAEIARQMKVAGIHVNFAPVADVNNNPANPVINNRSFGEDRLNVAAKSWRYAQGMQDHGVMACAKHFPGHGDTNVDSHYDLPVINHGLDRLDSIELFPFRELAKRGIGSMMVAHLNVPTLDARENRPTTLSYGTVTRLLKEGLEYDGLIFTDALEMKGVTKHFESGQVEAEALVAGNDVLLLPEDMEAAFSEIRKYLADGRLSWEQLEHSIKKVLRAKYELGVTQFEPLSTDELHEQLHTDDAYQLKRELLANALTLVRNPEGLIPFQDLSATKMAALDIGRSTASPFQQRLLEYRQMPTFQAPASLPLDQQRKLMRELSQADVVIVGLHNMNKSAEQQFGISGNAREFLRVLNEQTKVVLTVFGNPYSLQYFDDIPWVLEAYEEEEDMQALAAEGLFGARAFRGRLPVTASPISRFGDGVITRPIGRFGFAPPQEAGMDAATLAEIDGIVEEAIAERATPGCVVLVAKDEKIVLKKAYGYHTYAKEQRVQEDDVYDLASITKIAASTLAVMKLAEQGLADLDAPLANYLPQLAGTNKAALTLRDIMAHRAGLKDWIPFYQRTVARNGKRMVRDKTLYRAAAEPGFSTAVAPQLFLKDDFRMAIFQEIYDSPVDERPRYKYSDLGFYLIADLVERLSGQPLDQFVKGHFYQPLNLESAGFNPMLRGFADRIPPTEIDDYFRLQAVRGYVHDMGAAMLGGVSGHAGLFSNAKDLAVLMQMLLNGGSYGGEQLLAAETIRQFTSRHPKSTRRGIGFDMKQLDHSRWMNLPPEAANGTFGHTGFTGTCTWADPEQNLVFVFLSNRTYPDMSNFKLNKLGTRRRILSVIYESIAQYEQQTAMLASPHKNAWAQAQPSALVPIGAP